MYEALTTLFKLQKTVQKVFMHLYWRMNRRFYGTTWRTRFHDLPFISFLTFHLLITSSFYTAKHTRLRTWPPLSVASLAQPKLDYNDNTELPTFQDIFDPTTVCHLLFNFHRRMIQMQLTSFVYTQWKNFCTISIQRISRRNGPSVYCRFRKFHRDAALKKKPLRGIRF